MSLESSRADDVAAGMDFTADLAKAKRRWHILTAIQISVVFIASGCMLFVGFKPSNVSATSYLAAIMLNAGAAVVVGFCPKGLLDRDSDVFPPFAIMFSLLLPMAGFLGWAASTLLVFPLFENRHPPMIEMLNHPYGLFAAALILNGALVLIMLAGVMLLGWYRRR